jgi:hypothetical protein
MTSRQRFAAANRLDRRGEDWIVDTLFGVLVSAILAKWAMLIGIALRFLCPYLTYPPYGSAFSRFHGPSSPGVPHPLARRGISACWSRAIASGDEPSRATLSASFSQVSANSSHLALSSAS